MTGTPAAEFDLTSDFVARLLADQHPDLASLPLRAVESGWDNVMFRLGDRLAVRLPRRQAAAGLIIHEQIWLPRIADQLPLPVPSPVRNGAPALGYPWHWSVVPWLSGTSADQSSPSPDQAAAFGGFLRALHISAPADAPENPVRGVPLTDRSDLVEPRLNRLASAGLVATRIFEIWNDAVRAPIDVPPTWLHGDLHPRNVLVDHGRISGIIDWGDITCGDLATDLASIWMLFADAAARDATLSTCGPISSATALRAKGWAVLFGAVLLETGLIDNPRHAALGQTILHRLAETI